ncbi:lysozyme family protein [Metabacillus fastidiosus]|uniref:bifunctional lytic transglycosylase/C40 family peptidase n=1 Tax=Metabacillus fastidiosus TaxID=1458 RepID=UPI002E22E5B7|nr:lysozyme family protein [Metabacillus fastidiosus]
MVARRKNNQSNSNFRQQDSTARKLESDINTASQKQFAQTATVIDGGGDKEKRQGKLQKQHTNQSNHIVHEFKQQESTVNKIERPLETGAQRQFSQSGSVLNNNSTENNNSFANSNINTSSDTHTSSNTNKNKLQKKFSSQEFRQQDNTVNSQEFRQQESTFNKIESTLETGDQRQFSQSGSVLNNNSIENNNSFANSNINTSSDTHTSSNTNKNKLQKKFSSQEFRQQESTFNKIERPLETGDQRQFSQSGSVLNNNSTENNNSFANSNINTSSNTNKKKLQKQFSNQELRQQERTDNKIDGVLQTEQQKQFAQSVKVTDTQQKFVNEKSKHQKLKSSTKQRKRYKLTKQFTEGSIKTASNTLKSGVQKYQKELEKDDEAVKLTSQSITHVANISKATVKKLKEKRLESINFKKAKENPLYKEKPKESSLKKIAKTPVTALKNGAVRYQKELEKGDEGVKLASQSATQISRATKKLIKGTAKINTKSGKLGRQGTKLTQLKLNKGKKLKTEAKTILKKRAIKKKLYYAPKIKSKRRVVASVMSNFSSRMMNLAKSIAAINKLIVTKVLGAKVAAMLGSGLTALIPIILVAALVLIIVGIAGGSSEKSQPISPIGIGSKSFDPTVEQYRALVEAEAAAQGMEAYVNLILAIIQVETRGLGEDIMQSSESLGYGRNTISAQEASVRQGIRYLKSIVEIAKKFGLENDYRLLAQAYNFGSGFAGHVGRMKLPGSYTLDISEHYSKNVVAPSLGNSSGQTRKYVNPTSQRLGKTYLYRNGGNFMYGDLIAEYLGGGGVAGAGITGEFAIVMEELLKYEGYPYAWGGKSPSTSFDCSGLTSWGLAKIGIKIPSYAAAQYDLTVPVDPKDAQPGDLIFFRGTYGGPNHVSHVGFYINETTMYDSSGSDRTKPNSGVGYKNWKSPYWQKYFDSIRRVVRK